MATRILLVSLFLSLLFACDKKEDDMNPGKDYTGSLTLDYSRSFPTFKSGTSIAIDISANGSVTLTEPQQVSFAGESQKIIKGDRIKIREEGTITITSLSGKWVIKEGHATLEVNLSCLLNGTQTTWTYNGLDWIQLSQMPYTLENPVECPMYFRVDNAVIAEAVCGGSCNDCWGSSCFRWQLTLTPDI